MITSPERRVHKAAIVASRTASLSVFVLLLFLSTLPWWGAALTAVAVHMLSLLVAGMVDGWGR